MKVKNIVQESWVYVIRRRLEYTPGKLDIFAHSALLVYSKGKYTIVEYMSDGKVYTREVDSK